MDIDISDVWRIVKRHLFLIVAITAVTLALTWWISFYILKPEFEATSKLLVQSQNPTSQSAYSDLDTNQRLMTTYGEIIKSNRIAENVIHRLNLDMTPKELLKSVKVHANEDSLITTVTVVQHDPHRAVMIANGFAQSFYDNLGAIMQVDNVSILDEAKVPDNPTPVRPKPYVNMVVALALSLVVAVCLAIMMELLDRTVKTEETIEQLLGLPVLGVVSHFKHKPKRKRARHSQKVHTEGGTPIESKSSNSQAILP